MRQNRDYYINIVERNFSIQMVIYIWLMKYIEKDALKISMYIT